MRRIHQSLIHVVVCVVLAACTGGDTAVDTDVGTDTDVATDTDVGTDTDADTDTTACCSAAECSLAGLLCHPDTCECVAPTTCAADGASCLPAGTIGEDWACVGADGAFDGVCRATCDSQLDVTCATDDAYYCSLDDLCLPSECAETAAPDGCDTGEHCVNVHADASRCVTPGAGVAGTSCEDHEDCAIGLVCGVDGDAEEDATPACIAPTCTEMGTQDTCGEDEVCEALRSRGVALDVGTCVDAFCTPYVGDPGCGSESWCFPSADERGIGNCATVDGTAGLGDPCGGSTEETQCAAELLCLAEAEGARCRALCDPAAVASEPGVCPEQEACFALAVEDGGQSIDLAFGICEATCVYNPLSPSVPTESCPDEQVCLADYVSSASCLAEYTVPGAPLEPGAACPTGHEFEWCRPNALCLDLDSSSGATCVELCSASVGAGFGDASHPECTQPGTTCLSAFDNEDYGACR